MARDSSFLFSGITFNRKKFASDISLFKERKETEDDEEQELDFVENTSSKEQDANVVVLADRKRKRKSAAGVEGFNVFTCSSSKAVDEVGDRNEDEVRERRKEYHRHFERDALLRKKHTVHVTGSNIPSPLQNFAEFKLRYQCKSYLLRNLAELGFEEPTPIQRQAIPVLLSGRECFASAPTGSGKTFAFICPILMKLVHPSSNGIRAVILSPTRELAAQTAREYRKLSKGKKFRIRLMTKKLTKSADFSKMPCDILISTPFRVQFAVRKRKLDLSKVEFLVLDESDKLFELGLVEQVDAVVKACTNPSIVRSLFSATLPDTVEELARTIMHDAVRVIIGRKNSASESVKQQLTFVGSEEGKLLALKQIFEQRLNPPILLFVQNIERAKQLYEALKYDDVRADVMHADLSEMQRENVVDNFRSGKTWVLIATDVIARGMDFKGVNCVINYDFPDSSTSYIHRIGRSGRAGRRGEAITFYTEADVPFLKNVANVMTASGSEVPSWIMALPKKKWRKHRPDRKEIFTMPEDD